jgi:hypothetical protein
MNMKTPERSSSKKDRPKKRYRCIVFVYGRSDRQGKHLKYRVDDLLKFTEFLDKSHPNWWIISVYAGPGHPTQPEFKLLGRYNNAFQHPARPPFYQNTHIRPRSKHEL